MPAPKPFHTETTFLPRRRLEIEHYHCPCGEGTITTTTLHRDGIRKAAPEYCEPADVDDGPVEPCEACGNADLTADPATLPARDPASP